MTIETEWTRNQRAMHRMQALLRYENSNVQADTMTQQETTPLSHGMRQQIAQAGTERSSRTWAGRNDAAAETRMRHHSGVMDDTPKGAGDIDYDRLAEALAKRPMAIYLDSKATAAVIAKPMNRAIGNRNIQELMSMGG